MVGWYITCDLKREDSLGELSDILLGHPSFKPKIERREGLSKVFKLWLGSPPGTNLNLKISRLSRARRHGDQQQ